jgi:hypothetical protein
MTNIFEQPWLLLIVAGVVFLGLAFFRDLLPARRGWLFWLLPVVIAILAFAIDFFVQTDREKVEKVIARGVKAAEREDVDAAGRLVANDYHDTFNESREVFLARLQMYLPRPVIEKNILKIISLKVDSTKAVAVFTVRVLFDPQGPVYEYRKIMFLKFEAQLVKQGNSWLFNEVELLEVDMLPVDWKNLQSVGGELF